MSIFCFTSACDTNSVRSLVPSFYIRVYNLKEEIKMKTKVPGEKPKICLWLKSGDTQTINYSHLGCVQSENHHFPE